MSNLEKYTEAFCKAFNVDAETAQKLKFQDIDAWDSVGHMGLITYLEEAFDIMLEPDDIVDLSSFEKGKELLTKYDITF